MGESISSLSLRHDYKPTQWDRFLWWLSTAEKELLSECVVDRNRYRIIGTTVLATWAFATLAWFYFWTTITDSIFLSIPLGFFMGFIILTIDRALIKGINKFNKQKAAPLFLRAILAITIGTFMAQPAILFMFDKEIKLQASLDNEKRKFAKQHEMDTLYNPQISDLNTQKSAMQLLLLDKYTFVDKARQEYIAEMDGTGGSGKIGLKNIAMAKKAEYEKLDEEYKQLSATIKPQVSQIDSSLASITLAKNAENAAFAELLNDGFLTRIEALSNLVKNNSALQFRYYLIILILVLIELMPVLAKTLLPSGTYDEKVKLREEMEKELAIGNQQKEKELKELYNQLAKENDDAFLKEFFIRTKKERQDKLYNKLSKWSESENGSFDNFWETVKRDILTKQEN